MVYMSNRINKTILICISLLGTSTAIASSGNSGNEFRGNAIMALQTGGNNSMSGELAYAPLAHVGSLLGLRPLIGAAVFNSAYDGKKFLAPEAMLFAQLSMGSFFAEAGGGYHLWLGQNVSSPAVGGNLGFNFNGKWLGMFNEFFLGANYLTAKAARALEFKLGFGIPL